MHRLGREKISQQYVPSDEDFPIVFEIQKYNGPRNRRSDPHGEGKAKLVNGYRYEGFFRNGVPHGRGRLALNEGFRYEGRWRKGQKHGMGRMYYPDCSWYEGEFRKDLRHGCGVYHYPNGACYEGNWFGDKRHGVGLYSYARENIKLRGTWVEDVARGAAEVLFEGCRFHGYWEGEQPRGPGCFTFETDIMVRGKFYCDAKEGGEEKTLVWQPEAIEKYEYAKLPLEPLPLPVEESDVSATSSSEEEECDSVAESLASTIVIGDE
ncbi:radial spoke head 1 homolog [Culex pipiens pallens]|uniref:radial spoke head 1 homolog n=1 Tax=Culex pipiens pallens TaxID=42434 RepID=UPI001953026B|nr:radial spoke head 1 homolog [Culex pipiens pallens]